ncbi:ParB N-terminal domain-containing protein [Allorhodopirellula solitaria]|uniref:ParB/Sulfiredoxin domain-containing protein n=1 Tax=Allorhodopirellula solitaria TaxID=2527987 RepID=A0A5C5X2X0_9BACT|nr:hypothetical protein [Allorhodopirellula solitaria]TWT56525.1 hypothetical protein CA85_40580 [Allorhodopirellula solitaria]
MSKDKAYTSKYSIPDFDVVLAKNEASISEVHPTCMSVPMIDAQDFDRLVDAIRADGMIDSIRINDKKQLLDGRCRLSALYVLGESLEDSQVIVADHPAESIAEANYARRHLTSDQKAMRAVADLETERTAAADRKLRGSQKGRQSRMAKSNLDATDAVASKAKESRREPSLNRVAKEHGVPRQQLRDAEKVKKERPDLAEKVSNGQVSLDKARSEAGIKKTPTRRRNGKTASSDNRPAKQSDDSGKTLKYSDEMTSISDRQDGIRIVRSGDVTIMRHPDADKQVLVYANKNSWRVRTVGAKKVVRFRKSSGAEELAIKRIRVQLSSVTDEHT